MMPPVVQTGITPTAVTSTPDGVYGQMNVLLADNGIEQVLSAPADTLPGIAPGTKPSPEAAAFAREQWFLAQTAMIASEAPHTARAVVVAPPRRWNQTVHSFKSTRSTVPTRLLVAIMRARSGR